MTKHDEYNRSSFYVSKKWCQGRNSDVFVRSLERIYSPFILDIKCVICTTKTEYIRWIIFCLLQSYYSIFLIWTNENASSLIKYLLEENKILSLYRSKHEDLCWCVKWVYSLHRILVCYEWFTVTRRCMVWIIYFAGCLHFFLHWLP